MRPSAVIAVAVALSTVALPIKAQAEKGAKIGQFDYLVLTLSWSPTWCATKTGQSDKEQCGPKKYGFVLHGLWPQYAKGGYPRECKVDPGEVPAKVADGILPIMPSRKLIDKEWGRHGTCFGGDAAAYFGKARAAYDKIKIPATLKGDKPLTMTGEQIGKAFLDANTGMSPDSIAVTCRKPRGQSDKPLQLTDVRICLDKDLKYRACGRDVKDRCDGPAVIAAAK